MAVATNLEPDTQDAPEEPLPLAKSRFEQMFGRMNGSMTVVGDIVGPLPELWEFVRE